MYSFIFNIMFVVLSAELVLCFEGYSLEYLIYLPTVNIPIQLCDSLSELCNIKPFGMLRVLHTGNDPTRSNILTTDCMEVNRHVKTHWIRFDPLVLLFYNSFFHFACKSCDLHSLYLSLEI